MIFDNNLKEENFLTKPDEGITGNIKNYNNTNDMINKMLFSQVNTPTKISFENNNGINNKNQDNILRSNSTKNFYLNSTEKKKFNFNFLEENDNNFSDNLKKNEEQNNISNNFFKFNQNNKNNNSPTTNKNEIFTPIKNPQNKTFNFSNSFRSNLSMSYGLNNLSLNLVHRGLIMYQTAKKSHFRTRVSKGPPICLRWVSWLVLNNIPVKRSDSIIDYYLSKQIDKDLDKLIIKDIDRTFSNLNSNYFNEYLLKNSLYRILKAYATLDPEMGYCQGINLLTAFLLIICNYNEKDVFYILISILSNNYGDNFQIRGFFSEEFQHLKIFTFFFEEIFEKYNKKLRDHFNKLDLPIDVWAGRWFQTFFTICLPVEMCQRVWDCIFSIGPYFIFSFTLALLKEFENKLLAKNENIEIMEFFNKMQKNLATENINLSNSINNNDNAAGKLTENAYNFNIESVIKQAQKIKFTEKYFQKLKKNYFISNNIKKDFLTEKYFLKINEGEIENFVKDSTVDFRNNIINTMSSTNIKQNVNNLNTNMKNVNIKDLPNIINNIESNFILDFEKKNNLILDEEKNIKVEKNLNFNLTENKTKEFLQLENPEKNIFNSTNKLLNILNNNNLENKNSQNLKNENFPNTKNNNINDIRITSTSDTNIRKNFRNDLVTSIDNLKISPRFKNIDSNSNKKSINSKKDYFENAIFKTDISIENYPSNTNLNQKSIDIDKINTTNPKTCNNINDSIKNYKNKLELKKIEIKKVKDFNIAEFEYNINSEFVTGINKENSNINFEEYPKTEINKINNFEYKNNNKNNYIVTEDSQKNTDFYRKRNTSILNKNNLDYSQYAEKNNESCSFINEKKYSVYNHVNNSKGKKENYLINTNNINKNNSILNYNLNLQNKSYVNKYNNNSRFEIEEILPFNKYKNDNMEEFENNPDNEHISLPKNNQNYNMNNLRNKNSCEFPIIGGKIEKIDIKNALFRYSKNNPRYTWKQEIDQINK